MIDHHFMIGNNAYFEVQFQLQKLADGNGYAGKRANEICW